MKMKGVLFLGVYLLLLVNCQDSNQALFVRESPSKTGVNFKNTGDSLIIAPQFICEKKHIDEIIDKLRTGITNYSKS